MLRMIGLFVLVSGLVVMTSCESFSDFDEFSEDHQDRKINVAAGSRDPSPVWTGTEYGVCWEDYRNGDGEIYFSRISAAGAKIGADVRITNDAAGSLQPTLVWAGTEYGVCWMDSRIGAGEIYFSRISAAGAKIGVDVRITNDAAISAEPSLVWTGAEYGVCWMDSRIGAGEIYFSRISAAGAKIGVDVRITNDAAISAEPSLVWTGTEYGVCWLDYRDANSEIYFSRISAAGAKIGVDVRITNDAAISAEPSLVWTGTEYGVCWGDSRNREGEIYFSRISAAGIKIGADVQITNTAESWDATLVWTGTEYGVCWLDYRHGGDGEIYFSRISAAGAKIGADVRITTDAAGSWDPSLIWTGAEYGVYWDDYRNGNIEIYFSRISDVGAKIGADVWIPSDGD